MNINKAQLTLILAALEQSEKLETLWPLATSEKGTEPLLNLDSVLQLIGVEIYPIFRPCTEEEMTLAITLAKAGLELEVTISIAQEISRRKTPTNVARGKEVMDKAAKTLRHGIAAFGSWLTKIEK